MLTDMFLNLDTSTFLVCDLNIFGTSKYFSILNTKYFLRAGDASPVWPAAVDVQQPAAGGRGWAGAGRAAEPRPLARPAAGQHERVGGGPQPQPRPHLLADGAAVDSVDIPRYLAISTRRTHRGFWRTSHHTVWIFRHSDSSCNIVSDRIYFLILWNTFSNAVKSSYV